MQRYILEHTGKIISTLSGTIDLLTLNTLAESIYIDSDDRYDLTDYYDFGSQQFLSVGNQPTSNHVFDYGLKQWIDPRTLDDIKAQKWTSLKTQRNSFEFGGFEFQGNTYDSDQVSQGRMLGVVLAGLPQIWTLANNTTVSLSAEQLKSLYVALQMHIAVAHERGRIAREAIQAATTKEQIEAIVF